MGHVVIDGCSISFLGLELYCLLLEVRSMSDDLAKLLEMAKKVTMTPEELEQQRRSFAYGNARIENDRITRAIIDKAADTVPPPKMTR